MTGTNYECINENWLFCKDAPRDARMPDYDDSGWITISLPHDYSIESGPDENALAGNSGGYYPGGAAVYRKMLELPTKGSGKSARLIFEGVYKKTEVWLNGTCVARHNYGYDEFTAELTPFLSQNGINYLAVTVDNTDMPNCRWYSGSGIYRPVTLEITGEIRPAHCGLTVRSELRGGAADIFFEAEIENAGQSVQDADIIFEVFRGAFKATKTVRTRLEATETTALCATFNIQNPELWDIENPALYTSRLILPDGSEYSQHFGIRETKIDKDGGLFLNGRGIKLKGVCLHHDGGIFGAALAREIWQRRLEKLKEIGCNAIRTSHNPALRALLDLCDCMGFLIISEFYDKWGGHTNPEFDSDYMRDLPAMVRRDRFRPSVFMWSVGNEEGGRGGQGSPGMVEMCARLRDLTRENDPEKRPVTYAMHPHNDKPLRERLESANAIAKAVDVISCNYMEPVFEKIRGQNPDLAICSTEAYPFYNAAEDATSAYRTDNPYLTALRLPYCIGQFIWAGIDYLGEGCGWPSIGWAASPLDICAMFKPRAYFTKSLWSDKPNIHISVCASDGAENLEKPHWNAPPMLDTWNLPLRNGETAVVYTFTNCEKVILYADGRTLGAKYLKDYADRIITWHVPYGCAELTAEGYINGEKVCRDALRKAGEPANIEITEHRSGDMLQLEFHVTDADGTVVNSFNGEIAFSMKKGELLGCGNGNLEAAPVKNRLYAYRGGAYAAIRGKDIEYTANL